MSTNWVFDHIENTYTLNRRKDGMKKVSESLREQAKKLFFKKKEWFCWQGRRTKITSRCKKCYMWKKDLKKALYKFKLKES